MDLSNANYVGIAAQIGLTNELAVSANNVANANTYGFKSQGVVFAEYVKNLGEAGKPDKIYFSNDIGTYTNHAQGEFLFTNNDFDFALQGNGYFAVQTPGGVRYTRAGNFAIDGNGTLVTQQGYPVLNSGYGIVVFPLNDNLISVTDTGAIYDSHDQQIGDIGVFSFSNQQLLDHVGGGLFKTSATPLGVPEAMVRQGYLEQSNTNSVKEITKLTEIQRNVSHLNKTLNTVEELQRNAIKTLAKQN